MEKCIKIWEKECKWAIKAIFSHFIARKWKWKKTSQLGLNPARILSDLSKITLHFMIVLVWKQQCSTYKSSQQTGEVILRQGVLADQRRKWILVHQHEKDAKCNTALKRLASPEPSAVWWLTKVFQVWRDLYEKGEISGNCWDQEQLKWRKKSHSRFASRLFVLVLYDDSALTNKLLIIGKN